MARARQHCLLLVFTLLLGLPSLGRSDENDWTTLGVAQSDIEIALRQFHFRRKELGRDRNGKIVQSYDGTAGNALVIKRTGSGDVLEVLVFANSQNQVRAWSLLTAALRVCLPTLSSTEVDHWLARAIGQYGNTHQAVTDEVAGREVSFGTLGTTLTLSILPVASRSTSEATAPNPPPAPAEALGAAEPPPSRVTPPVQPSVDPTAPREDAPPTQVSSQEKPKRRWWILGVVVGAVAVAAGVGIAVAFTSESSSPSRAAASPPSSALGNYVLPMSFSP
jgi:hypothetical protein